MGMIRGGGRTQHVCSTDTHTPAASTGLATWIQAEWVQHGTLVPLALSQIIIDALPVMKISTFLPDIYAVFSSITSW